ncbi:MAG: DUF402 domain-containing protein [Chloroflexi bacterium]|nr:DUF402 domain-containing protein [Chloroflexota bacterium]
MKSIDVIKLDHEGRETFRYQGQVLKQDQDKLVLEAYFGFEEVVVEDLIIIKGDRFVERFYSDRWYNIFEIHAGEDDQLKGWYCNIGHPAVFENGSVSYRDLALDLLVYPDGRQVVLDEDEFATLDVSEEIKQQARQGLRELQTYIERIRKDLS